MGHSHRVPDDHVLPDERLIVRQPLREPTACARGAPERSTTTGPCTEMILATRGSQPWACTRVAVHRSAIKMAPQNLRPPSMRTMPFPLQHGV
jgi:hypothetical protein